MEHWNNYWLRLSLSSAGCCGSLGEQFHLQLSIFHPDFWNKKQHLNIQLFRPQGSGRAEWFIVPIWEFNMITIIILFTFSRRVYISTVDVKPLQCPRKWYLTFNHCVDASLGLALNISVLTACLSLINNTWEFFSSLRKNILLAFRH